MRQNRVPEAFRTFETAFDLVGDMLKQEHILLVPGLYHLILHLRHRGGREVFVQLFNPISNMVEWNYPQMFSVRCALSIIDKMSTPDGCEAGCVLIDTQTLSLRTQPIRVMDRAACSLMKGIIGSTFSGTNFLAFAAL